MTVELIELPAVQHPTNFTYNGTDRFNPFPMPGEWAVVVSVSFVLPIVAAARRGRLYGSSFSMSQLTESGGFWS